MRLLNTLSLQLVEVPEDAVPSYAILSHTWGDQEITLQEMERIIANEPDNRHALYRIAQKEGFLKVKAAAAMALTRGLEYLWVDTCCIDKSSSAELSEAINSMYLWYRQSKECYAFLSDVGPEAAENWTDPQSSIYRSRWFTRGWTLQELIAPRVVLFYASDWTFLGQKDKPESFTRVISEVTGVGCEILDGRIDPLQLSVSARMAWASRRLTTRREDVAYCLMGLFQVNMPLLYGEGARAFRRLQEAILQQTDDQSLFAWNSADTIEDEDQDALSSLLAKSPAQFAHAGDIQPLPPLPTYASMPSSMTNQGLHVHLYLRPAEDDFGGSYEAPMEEDYDAILDCVIRVDNTYFCPVIRLRRLSEDQYGRIQTRSRRLLPPPSPSDSCSDDEGYHHVYVRQEPTYYHLPQFRIPPSPSPSPPDSDFGINSTMSSSDESLYRFSGAFPPRQWNSHTMTLTVNYSRKIQAMGLFRYQSSTWEKTIIDVVVGLRRLNAMQWEGWCFQTRSGSSLEESFSLINNKISKAIEGTKHADISPSLLRDTVGDDARLITDATVSGTQLQGRLYVSITLATKPEVQAVGVTLTSDQQEKLRAALAGTSDEGESPVDEPDFQNLESIQREVQLLTRPCYQTNWDEFVNHDPVSIVLFNPRAVRSLRIEPEEETESLKEKDATPKSPDGASDSPRSSSGLLQPASHERRSSSARSSWNTLRPLSHIMTTSATLTSPFEPTRMEKLRSTSSPLTSKPTNKPPYTGFFARYVRDFISELKEGPVANFTASPVQMLAIALFDGEKEKAEKIISRYPELLTSRHSETVTSDKYGLYPVHWAVAGGFNESLELLVEKGGTEILRVVSRGGLGALHIAAMCASPSWTVIRDAIDMDSFTALASLPTNHLEDTPLHVMAAYYSRRPTASDSDDFFTWLQLVGELVSNVSTDSRNLYEETPLHRAAACNNEAMIDFLLSQARNRHLIDASDKFGRTPIWHAAATGSAEAAKALIKTGASINLADDLGMTPLHAACRGGHCDVIQLLLKSKAYITSETLGLNFTALDYAAMFGHAECVKVLATSDLYLGFPEATPWMKYIDSQVERDNRLRWIQIKTKALQIASSCGWFDSAASLCRYHANPLILMSYYLKLNDAKSYAFVVAETSSALTAAGREGHENIVEFLKASSFEKYHDSEHSTDGSTPPDDLDSRGDKAHDGDKNEEEEEDAILDDLDADSVELPPGSPGYYLDEGYSTVERSDDVLEDLRRPGSSRRPVRRDQPPGLGYRKSSHMHQHEEDDRLYGRQPGWGENQDTWKPYDNSDEAPISYHSRSSDRHESGRPESRQAQPQGESRLTRYTDFYPSGYKEYYSAEPPRDPGPYVGPQQGQSTVLTIQTGSGPGYSRFGSQRSAQPYQQHNPSQYWSRPYEPPLPQRSVSGAGPYRRKSSKHSDRSPVAMNSRLTSSVSARQRPYRERRPDYSPPMRSTTLDEEDPSVSMEYSDNGPYDVVRRTDLSLPGRPKPRLRLSPATTYSKTILSAPPDVNDTGILQPRILGPMISPNQSDFQHSPDPLGPREEIQERTWEMPRYSPISPGPQSVERRLLSMLGALGHPSMIEPIIHEDELGLQYDETYGIVYRAPGLEEDGAERDKEGLPVYELPAVDYD